MEYGHFHMVYDIVEVMKEPHVEDKHEESSDLQVLLKGDAIEYLGQTFELLHQYIQEGLIFRYASKGTYLSRDWIDKYLTEMEVQGCISFSCIYREFFDMHALEERPQEIPIWIEYLAMKRVSDYIPHKLESHIFYSSMDWVDEYISKMEIHQGEKYVCLYYKYFGFTDIVLPCG